VQIGVSKRRVFIELNHPDKCENFLYNTKEVLLDKLIVTQLIKRFQSFHGTRRFITVFTTFRHWYHLSQMNPYHTLPPCFPKIHSNIVFPYTPLSSQWPLLFKFSDQNYAYISHLSHACYMPPYHPP